MELSTMLFRQTVMALFYHLAYSSPSFGRRPLESHYRSIMEAPLYILMFHVHTDRCPGGVMVVRIPEPW